MESRSRVLPIAMIFIGALGLIMGVVYVYQGVSKSRLLKQAMLAEKVSLGDVHIPDASADEIIDSAEKALVAADTIKSHRRKIAATYKDLLGEKKFNPSDPKQLLYAQGLNLESYLYLAVMGFGLTKMAIASGIFMILMGISIGSVGISLSKRI